MIKILISILSFFSRAILRRYRPRIVGITGSVGKTSTKEAAATVLSRRFKVRQSKKSYNNEIGLPLTIIGAVSAGRSVFGWLKIFLYAAWLIIYKNKNYPEILILEMGADRPGDIKYLTEIAPCDIGVLTAIAPNHLERFKTIEAIAREKKLIITRLKPNGVAVFNRDDEIIVSTRPPEGIKMITFGFNDEAMVRATDIIVYGSFPNFGMSFKVTYEGSSVPVHLPNVVGQPSVYAALGAIGIGLSLGMNLVMMADALGNYQTPPGRERLLHGIKGTLIVDDSYNASPRAALAALETFSLISVAPAARRFVVFGDMLDLGEYTEKAHEEVGKKVAATKMNFLITVGELSRIIAREARLGGLPAEAIVSFYDISEAGRFLQEQLRGGDIVLIKGSQDMRMERVVKEVMAEPERAKELLVRQGEGWLR